MDFSVSSKLIALSVQSEEAICIGSVRYNNCNDDPAPRVYAATALTPQIPTAPSSPALTIVPSRHLTSKTAPSS